MKNPSLRTLEWFHVYCIASWTALPVCMISLPPERHWSSQWECTPRWESIPHWVCLQTSIVQACAFIPQLHALLLCLPAIQPSAGLASPPNHSLIYWDRIMISLPCNFNNLGRSLIFALTTLRVSIHTSVFSISLLANWRKDLFVFHSLTNDKVFGGKHWVSNEYLLNKYICYRSGKLLHNFTSLHNMTFYFECVSNPKHSIYFKSHQSLVINKV